MTASVAIIGSGPTGIYTLKGLIASSRTLSITVFETEADPGKGTPYHPDINDQAMLANIASFELPPVCETLVEWLRRQPAERLHEMNLSRDTIDERAFYPRVVLGAYFEAQFWQVVEHGIQAGHVIDIKPLHRVVDIHLRPDDIRLTVRGPTGAIKEYASHHVVMATGHNWPEITETKPGYFVSPWPASALKNIGACAVGILGTSLSAIDALITVATAHGAFYLDPAGQLQYEVKKESEPLRFTLMSRKGLLPEADFYFDYPHKPLAFCTPKAVDALISRGSVNLLDEIFELFRRELVACDEGYAASIGLSLLKVETFAPAYYAAREAADPFVWAASNRCAGRAEQGQPLHGPLARCHSAHARGHRARRAASGRERPPALSQDLQNDLRRRLRDGAASVHPSAAGAPPRRPARASSRWAMTMRSATDTVATGAEVRHHGQRQSFDAFIDATGQPSMSVEDLPFPGLIAQGVLKPAATPEDVDVVDWRETTTHSPAPAVSISTRPFDPNLRRIFPTSSTALRLPSCCTSCRSCRASPARTTLEALFPPPFAAVSKTTTRRSCLSPMGCARTFLLFRNEVVAGSDGAAAPNGAIDSEMPFVVAQNAAKNGGFLGKTGLR